MVRVNYMGGKLSTVRTRNKDTTLRIQKSHFGKQRLKTLSDYLQAINNPVPRLAPGPISGISLAHARRESRQREAGSDPSIPGRHYHSYIPSPSKVSSESSDSLDARTLSAKLRTSRMLLELARLEPTSLDYERKRLLETPDLAGLAERKRRIEATKKQNLRQFQNHQSETAKTYGIDEEIPMVTSRDSISDVSSLLCEVSGDSIDSWSEWGGCNDKVSPVSLIRSFSANGSGVTSIVTKQKPSLNRGPHGMDASMEEIDSEENVYPATGDYSAQSHTSDSVALRAQEPKTRHTSNEITWNPSIFNPNNISMSDEWFAFSRLLDATYRGFKLPETQRITASHQEVICSDSVLGLDFHVFPHLIKRSSKQTDVPPLKPIENSIAPENIYSASSNSTSTSAATAQHINPPNQRELISDACTTALSDIPSILLSCISSGPNPHSDDRINMKDEKCVPIASHRTDDVNEYRHDTSSSRTQWDQLMDELVGSAPVPHRTAHIDESDSNSSHIANRSSNIANFCVSSPFVALSIGSSDDQDAAALQNAVDKDVASPLPNIPVLESGKSGKSGKSLNQAECNTPEIVSGPILFAFTFTSDVDED